MQEMLLNRGFSSVSILTQGLAVDGRQEMPGSSQIKVLGAVLVLVTGTGEEVVPYFYKLVVGEGDTGI
jgi:hypothetical protein